MCISAFWQGRQPARLRHVSEACSINIEHLSTERGHRTVKVVGKGAKVARQVDGSGDTRRGRSGRAASSPCRSR